WRESFPLRREGDVGRADGERVAGRELRALHAAAVHLDPVRRVEVDDPVRRALLPELRVAARDVRVLDLDVGLARAPEDDAARVDAGGLALPREDGDLALDAEILERRGLGRLRDPRLVDHRRAGLDLLLRAVGAAPALGLHHPRRDAELADGEV